MACVHAPVLRATRVADATDGLKEAAHEHELHNQLA